MVASVAFARSPPPPVHVQFDADRALAAVQKQVDFGPRPSGSPELKQTRAWLVSELRSYGLEVREQEFDADTPRGKIHFVNILARMPPTMFDQNKQLVVLGSHYDTKWLPKIRFVGANDGASSTGALLEIARVTAQTRFQPSKARLEFVFFDGEECVNEYTETDGLYGSRYYVSQLKSKSPNGKITNIQCMLLLDMIGDRDLSVRLPDATPELARRALDASEALGWRENFHISSQPMIDDHRPLSLEGVPSMDLIDFEYGPNHRWWHTEEDTMDKIHAQSLKMVGQTLLKLLEGL